MKKQFTLLELLIVVAIIGILASMLLPMLQKAKERGTAALCLCNLKMLGVVCDIYVEEHEDWLPEDGTSGNQRWTHELWPLLFGNSPIPVDNNIWIKSEPLTCPVRAMKQWVPASSSIAYGWNATICPPGSAGGPAWNALPDRYRTIMKPSETWVLGDHEISRVMNNYAYFQYFIIVGRDESNQYEPSFFRHNCGVNILYADWHAGWQPRNAFQGNRLPSQVFYFGW